MEEFKLRKSGRIKGLKRLLRSLTYDDIQEAIAEYEHLEGNIKSYHQSTGYDLIANNKAYPPKAIFGLAASKHLGQSVLSRHFTGGENSECFDILRALGSKIKPKTESKSLNIHHAYTRKQVCNILSPKTHFKSGAGHWGLHGIIRVKTESNDFVLFVTLSQYDGNDYDDAITEDGYLLWKSQNQHNQDSEVIQHLVQHNHNQNNIYLFVRAQKSEDYTYFGPLALQDWDPSSNHPVHLQWQILCWPLKRS
ncbi:DUF3427 domain-containing protein [Ferrimonas sp.]|uniref:DUF3427 domain-containing protein n=1 Tax=Ferrimonas sp. TaxID=2080861 RepID=UPI003A90E34D